MNWKKGSFYFKKTKTASNQTPVMLFNEGIDFLNRKPEKMKD